MNNNTQTNNSFANFTNNSKINIDVATLEFDFDMCHGCCSCCC
jgi:hypothetical protein